MRTPASSALLAVVFTAFLTGCSTYVTVVSDPEGALITDASGSIVYGRAPLDVEYDTDELKHRAHPGQCPQIPGFTARWPSGASASSASPLPVCDLRRGLTVRILRPQAAPGLEEDLRWALERAQKRARDAEIERDRMMLYMDRDWFWGPGWGLWPRMMPPPPAPIHRP